MAKGVFTGPLEQVDACCYRIPKSYKQGMRVDGLIFANEQLLRQLKLDQAPEQVATSRFAAFSTPASRCRTFTGAVASHRGVCAFDPEEDGVISPGGVGYDINCGVRLCRTNLFIAGSEHLGNRRTLRTSHGVAAGRHVQGQGPRACSTRARAT